VFAEQSSTVTATPQRKYLSALMYEYRDLSNQYDQQVNKVDIVEQPNDTILEIEFREQLDKEIEQYKATIGYIKEQLQQTTMSLRK
jgi:effector-binding domain-containing protein